MPQLLHAGLQAALDRLAERHPAIARAARSKAKQGRAYGQLLSAVSPKGASGIAQFMPQTADWHGLADPFDPIEALRHSAAYLRELRDQFGNLGLAAAAHNAGPGRVSAWLASHRPCAAGPPAQLHADAGQAGLAAGANRRGGAPRAHRSKTKGPLHGDADANAELARDQSAQARRRSDGWWPARPVAEEAVAPGVEAAARMSEATSGIRAAGNSHSHFATLMRATLLRQRDQSAAVAFETSGEVLFWHLRQRWQDLFGARFDVLLYDLTSTYFEFAPPDDEADKRRHGYSRDKRSDCVQVVIALIVTPDGFPLGYEVLAGNTSDKTTLRGMLRKIEAQYVSRDNLDENGGGNQSLKRRPVAEL